MLGIHFGTSDSGAARVGSDGQLRMMALEPHRPTMPTALFFASDSAQLVYGTPTLQSYLQVAREQSPGVRLIRSIKNLLDSKLMDKRTAVNGQRLSFFVNLVRFLRQIKVGSERTLGHEVRHAMLGRPVHVVGADGKRDALAPTILEHAALAAGFNTVRFRLEPIAAAFDYERRVSNEAAVLGVAIGGGTSDFTVIRLGPQRQEHAQRGSDVFAAGGVHLDGTDFLRLLNLRRAMPLLGFGHIVPEGREVPHCTFLEHLTWHLVPHAHAKKNLPQAKDLGGFFAAPALHRRLMQVLPERLGRQIVSDVDAAKIACFHSDFSVDINLTWLDGGARAALGCTLPYRQLLRPKAPWRRLCYRRFRMPR